MKGRQRCKQLSGNDPSLIVTPFTDIQIDYLYQQNYLWKIAISNYSGQFDNHYPKDLTIKFLTSQAWILPLITASKPLANAITVYTDGTSKGRASYIIYSPSGTYTEQINIATPGATAQHAEIFVVLAALQLLPGLVNTVSDSQYVIKAINSTETARLKGDLNSTIFHLFFTYSHGLKWGGHSGLYFSMFYYSYPFTYRPAWPYG
jgi:hypothetical protein